MTIRNGVKINNKKIFHKKVGGVFRARGFLGAKQKRENFKKFVKWVLKGFRPSGNKKRYPKGVELERVLDREHPSSDGSYTEVIKDVETGEIICNKKEPLNKHK